MSLIADALSPRPARLRRRSVSRFGRAARVGGDVAGTAEVAREAGPRTLADLRCGQRTTIVGYDGDPLTGRRLRDLGLAPGAEIEMVRVAPLRDPVIFRVADYELALRRTEARGIRVQERPE